MKPRRHFLQTEAWGAFQKALKRKVIIESGDGWRWMAVVERGRLGTRLYCPYGPTATTVPALRQALQALRDVAREHEAVFVRIEPITPITSEGMRELGAVPAPHEIQPGHTWRVDLTPPEDELIAAMRATTRNLHRTAAKKGLSFRKSDDPKEVKTLLGFVHEVAQRNNIRPHNDRYFRLQAKTLMARGAAHLFFAEYKGKPIAAALVYDHSDTRFYAHAGAATKHRRLHAGTPLVSHMMLDAKKSGLKTFDLYGIAPPDQPNHPWSGFTSFKQSFGGYQHDFAGTWDIPLKSFPYRIYRAVLNITKSI